MNPRHVQVDKAVDRILAEVDKDGDGRLCYAEFCDMLRHQPDPPELRCARACVRLCVCMVVCVTAER
jgi:hypothetical protein